MRDLAEWSIDLEDRYCMYQMAEGEHDDAREAMRAHIYDPIQIDVADPDPEVHGQRVEYRGVYIGDIWPPDEWDDNPQWGNYPAPIIRVDDETPITAGYSFSGGYDEAAQWFVNRLARIKQGDWRRGSGR